MPFGIIWLVSGLVFLIVEKAAAGNGENLPATGIQMDFKIFIFSSLAITGVGLLVGVIELVYLNNLFAKKSFTKKVLYKVVVYTLVIFVITLITYPIAASIELNTSLFDQRVWDKLLSYLTSFPHLSTDVQLATALFASIFYAEISENVGHGVLMNFFTGKYHAPVEENMKSSTTIAEELGHIRYFEMLKEYYADISKSIVEYSGEVYQYVGDEIIVSWKYETGIKNNNCVKCFFAMKEDLQKRGEWYKEKFGLIPSFKAGIHFGKVTTGEIGVLTKDIMFTGDVLNAAARIQGLCNTYNAELLISAELMERLNLSSEYQLKSLGKNELRGRKENIELYTIA